MAKKVFQNPGKIIRDDSGKPILDKNGNYVYAPQSGRADITMAPYEYLMALPENAIGDAALGLAGKVVSPLIKYGSTKVIPKIANKIKSVPVYKVNPFAERLVDKNASFRVVGEDAYEDFLQSGVVRSGKGAPTDLGDGITSYRPTSFPSFQKGYADTSYAPSGMESYVFKTKVPTFARGEKNPVTGNIIRGRHYAHRPIDMQTGNVITELPAKDVSVFSATPNWLTGYKQIKEDGGRLNSNDMTNEYKSGGWIKNAVNPAHRGFCSPMTKSTCTPRRKAFAMTMKKHHGFHADGGYIENPNMSFNYEDGGYTYLMPNRELNYAGGGQLDPYLQYYDAQSLYTKALQDKYPKVPIKDILSNSAKDKSFKHDKLESMSDSLRSKYGDISLSKDDIGGLVNAGYPDILGLNNNIEALDKANSKKSVKTTGSNEPNNESFGWRMLLQRSYPKGSTPYKYLDNEKSYGGKLMFLGGLTGATALEGSAEIGGQLSGMINPNTKGGGATSGALKGASMGASMGPYGIAAGSVLGGTMGLINAQNQQNRETFAEQNNAIKQRNSMLGIKAKGGLIVPMGVSNNMISEYAEGGQLTEFNNGGRHETNPMGGVPQGFDGNGNPNLVEEGETKFNDYIFSDRLMLDKDTVAEHNLPKSMEGKTFAEASKKLNKLYKERPNDFITKSTAKDYLTRLTAANDKARSIDESNNVMAYGGNIYDGGGVKRTYYDENANELLSGRVGNEFFKPGLTQKIQMPKLETSKLKAKTDSIAANNKEVPSFFSDPKNLRYAPIAFDALASTGLFGKTPTPSTISSTLIQNQGMLSPQAIDEMQTRKAVDEAYQTGVSGLAESAGGSGSALRAGLSGLTSDYMSGIGKSFADANRANMAQKQAADQFNLQTQGNLAAQNAQLMNQANLYNNQLMNAKSQAGYENRLSYLGKAAEGVGDIGYESRLGEILPKIYGYDQYGNYAAPLGKKACGGRLRLKNYKK